MEEERIYVPADFLQEIEHRGAAAILDDILLTAGYALTPSSKDFLRCLIEAITNLDISSQEEIGLREVTQETLAVMLPQSRDTFAICYENYPYTQTLKTSFYDYGEYTNMELGGSIAHVFLDSLFSSWENFVKSVHIIGLNKKNTDEILANAKLQAEILRAVRAKYPKE
ncbi:hypothetical protein EOM81_01730 [bacterium]|nr:hypothetical protein [bacterium]